MIKYNIDLKRMTYVNQSNKGNKIIFGWELSKFQGI